MTNRLNVLAEEKNGAESNTDYNVCYGYIVSIAVDDMSIERRKVNKKRLGDGCIDGYMMVEATYTMQNLKAGWINFGGPNLDHVWGYWDLPEPIQLQSEEEEDEMVLEIGKHFGQIWCHPDLKVKRVTIKPCFYGDELEELIKERKAKGARATSCA